MYVLQGVISPFFCISAPGYLDRLEPLVADEEAVAGLHGRWLEEAVGAVFPGHELMGVAGEEYELEAEGEAELGAVDGDAPEVLADGLHDEGLLGLPTAQFGDVAYEGEDVLGLDAGGFAHHGEPVGLQGLVGQLGILVVADGMGLEDKGEETAVEGEATPVVPDLEGGDF